MPDCRRSCRFCPPLNFLIFVPPEISVTHFASPGVPLDATVSRRQHRSRFRVSPNNFGHLLLQWSVWLCRRRCWSSTRSSTPWTRCTSTTVRRVESWRYRDWRPTTADWPTGARSAWRRCTTRRRPAWRRADTRSTPSASKWVSASRATVRSVDTAFYPAATSSAVSRASDATHATHCSGRKHFPPPAISSNGDVARGTGREAIVSPASLIFSPLENFVLVGNFFLSQNTKYGAGNFPFWPLGEGGNQGQRKWNFEDRWSLLNKIICRCCDFLLTLTF